MVAETSENVLLVRSGAQVCALALRDVSEAMRPLPVAPLAGVPPFVSGVAVVRGEPAPVVLLHALLGGARGGGEPARFVLVRTGSRRALLAVDDVLGVASIPRGEGLPLLSSAADGAISTLGALDRELLAVLDASRVVPDDVWRAVDTRGSATRGSD
jgi:purine-binding chemotaxis protein CheW